MKHIYRAFFILMLGVAAIPPCIYLMMEFYYLPRLNPSFSRIETDRIELFINDLKRIEKSGFLSHQTRNKNAREFLNQYISWQSPQALPLLPEERRINDFFNGHSHYLFSKDQFAQFVNDPAIHAINTDWMSELKTFDHWNPLDHPANVELLKSAKKGNSLDRLLTLNSLHVPRSSNLALFATIRLVKEYKKNPLGAYEEYLHIMRLIHSQNNLAGLTTAAYGYIHAGQIRKQFLPFEGIPEFNEHLGVALRRVSWVWPATLDFVREGAFPERLRPFLKPEFGVCAGAVENPLGIRAFYELIQPDSWPLEHNFSEASKRSLELRRELFRLCELKEFQFFLEPPAKESVFQDAHSMEKLVTIDPRTPTWLIKMGQYPYFRRLLYGVLSRVTYPRAFAIYELKMPAPTEL